MSIFSKIKSSLINRMETLEQRKINHLINKKRSIKYNDIDMTFFVPNALNRYRVKTFATKELDDYLQKAGVKYVDLLKIDTQGFEPEVLEGTGELLQNVDVVLTELMFYDYYERSLSFSDIEKYVNLDSVICQKIETEYWVKYLKTLIEEHYAETNSEISKKIINDFDRKIYEFIQVCPKEMIDKLENPITNKINIQEVS